MESTVLKVVCLCIAMAFIVAYYTPFVQTIKAKRGKRTMKPFDCPTCLSFHFTCIALVFLHVFMFIVPWHFYLFYPALAYVIALFFDKALYQ